MKRHLLCSCWKPIICIFALSALNYAAPVGDFSSYTQSGNTIDITVSNGIVRIYVVDTNIMRVSYDTRSSNQFSSTDADVLNMSDVNRTFPVVSPLTVTDDTTLDIATSAMLCRIQKSPFRIYWYAADGTTELTHDAAAMDNTGSSSGTPAVTFNSAAAEQYYGWGVAVEQFRNTALPVNRKGITYSCRETTAHYMYSTGPATSGNIGYGVWLLFQEPFPGYQCWGCLPDCLPGAGFSISTGSGTAKFFMHPGNGTDPWTCTIMDYLSYYFIKGDWKTAMDGYTKVSGRPPRLGKKFYGIMRDMYPGPGVSVPFANFASWDGLIRSKHMNMDWIRMDDFFDWTNLCQSPIATNCWNTGVPAEVQNYHTESHLLFSGMNVGWNYYGCCGSGCTNHVCQTVAAAQIAINNGYDWAWYDAMDYHARWQARDQWNVWVQAHNNIDGDGQGETKTMISRGWQSVSSQAWPGATLGDYLGDYKYKVFSSQLEEALVGYASSHSCLAEGNRGDEWGYAGYYLRPMIAIHMAGAAGNSRTDFPASIDAIENYSGTDLVPLQKWGNKHYRFIPYLFTYGMIAHETGCPVTRGMMCQNGGEADASTYALDKQAYVGDYIIWSPAYPDLNGTTTRTGIYLPKGTWYDFWLDGGQPAVSWTGPTTISYATNPAAGFRVPTFVKAGAIIPLQDSLEWIGQKPETLITLNLFPVGGPTSSSFTLYEDEGAATWNTTYSWCDAYTTQPVKSTFSYTMSGVGDTVLLTIGAMTGTSRYCSTGPATRHYRVEVHGIATPWGPNGWVNQRAGTSGEWTMLPNIIPAQYAASTPGWYYDAANGGTLYAALSLNGSADFQVKMGPNVAATAPFNRGIGEKVVSIQQIAGALRVIVPWTNHTVEILNVQGRVITRRNGNFATTYMIPLERQATIMYLVRVSGQGQQPVIKKIML